jgi:hypothetical protein
MIDKNSLEERFWVKVDSGAPNGCWEWTGGCDRDGYGKIKDSGKTVKSHRASWEIHNGPIPEGALVLHKCDNPKCVRPAHLLLGTDKENAADKVAKGRQGSLKGESLPQSRLREPDVRSIREMYRRHQRYTPGLRTFLCKWFGVSPKTVQDAACGITWRTA